MIQGEGLRSDVRAQILTELRRWHVTEVVLGPMDPHGGEMRTFLTGLLGSPPRDGDGVAVWKTVPPP